MVVASDRVGRHHHDVQRVTAPPTVSPSLETFRTARDLGEVISAWRLVHDCYVRTGLIDPHPDAIHTTPQAVTEQAVVFHSDRSGQTESTLTVVVDSPNGLPLDQVFGKELDKLRATGKLLLECGLFAHEQHANPSTGHRLATDRQPPTRHRQREALARTRDSLIGLMRMAFWFGINNRVSDFVVGVHPKHAKFYIRAFGFEQVGPEKTYPAVNNRPVVLLTGDLHANLRRRPLPFAIHHCLEHPVPRHALMNRCLIQPHMLTEWLAQTHGWMRYQYPGLPTCSLN